MNSFTTAVLVMLLLGNGVFVWAACRVAAIDDQREEARYRAFKEAG